MSSVAKFRLRLVIENALFLGLALALFLWKPGVWISIAAVAVYVGIATLLHRLIPPPPR